jgi:hypothetical protein
MDTEKKQWIIITEGNKCQGQEYCNGDKYGCSKQVRRGELICNRTLAMSRLATDTGISDVSLYYQYNDTLG